MSEDDVQEICKMSQRLYRLRVYSELSTVDKVLFADKHMTHEEWSVHVADSLKKIEDILNKNKDMANVEAWQF